MQKSDSKRNNTSKAKQQEQYKQNNKNRQYAAGNSRVIGRYNGGNKKG
jgi:hypothetical protein